MSSESAPEEKLRQQRDDLELLNELMRHDIRNDLQVIQAYVSMLEEYLNDDGQTYLNIVEESTAHAIELTRTVGDLSQVMLQEEAKTERVSLESILTQQIEQARTAYPDAIITTDTLPDVLVIGDEMLGSVFRNLLQNAIKHNDKEPPEVHVSTSEREDTILIRVADNGPGIADEQKETIFGRGEQGLESPGAGIGLYLVESLVTMYGGDVWIEDNDPHGAIFIVQLSLTADTT